MKLRIMSDLHLEFGPLRIDPIGEDILLLAGDIGINTQGIDWAIEYADRADVLVIMIAGNHEFYQNKVHKRHTFPGAYEDFIKKSTERFVFLQDQFTSIGDLRVWGSTLWTDFELNCVDHTHNYYDNMKIAEFAMNDYRKIHHSKRYDFMPEDTREANKNSIIELILDQVKDVSSQVVMTHHLPSAKSLGGRYANSYLNFSYASNLDELVEQSGVKLWIHGHTHISKDYMIGDTRVICNPRGYHGFEVNPDFNPNLIVEI